MKTMFILFLWGTIGLMVFGCEEREDELQSQIDNLEFELMVLDEESKQQSVFEPFTDVIFAVKITNQSDKDFLWEYSYDCQLIQLKEFLLVYKAVNSSETGGNKIISVGKPYPYPIDCLLFDLPPKSISPGSEFLFRGPWSANPDNHPLGPGKYFTKFQHTLDLGERSKNIDVKVEFEMK